MFSIQINPHSVINYTFENIRRLTADDTLMTLACFFKACGLVERFNINEKVHKVKTSVMT